MLGNWSFGDYFKEEACRYAWNLLTKHYGIPKEFLYVTYFSGDETLELEPDLECKDIWLSIGVPKDKIIPFGVKDNFWEMGVSGPCGPCTEIHVDHTKQEINQSTRINKGHTDLTELWNIVFIQYERQTNGSIIPLSKHHVDTGMGLERLVALLQEKESNYDTDLFQPLFKTIQNYAKSPEYEGRFYNDENGLDSGYRILADHSRMITVALADGMIPEQSNKLRKIIRKVIDVGERVFRKEGLLTELSYTVADNLGDVYPELQKNLKKVQNIIEFEEDLFKKLRNTSGKEWKKIVEINPQLTAVTDWMSPGLVGGYKYLQSTLKDLKKAQRLSGTVAFKLYDTHGLSINTIIELAQIESLYFDKEGFEHELEKMRSLSRIGLEKTSEISLNKCTKSLKQKNIPETNDKFKYEYTFDGSNYQFPTIESKIIGLIINDTLIQDTEIIDFNIEADDENEIGIILDKTLCYSLEGGQTSDKGQIQTKNLLFNVSNVRKINGYVIHFGKFTKNNFKNRSENVKIGDSCVVSINPEHRIGIMQHHTGTHLLNASLKQVMQVIYPRNSVILPHILKLQYNSFGEKLSVGKLKKIEKCINSVIEANIPISTKIMNSSELLADDSVILIPGEIYPYTGIRVVEINAHNLKSKEACCGTHVDKTGILQHFCFLSYSSKGIANFTVKAVTGLLAISAKLKGENLQHKILNLENKLKTGQVTHDAFKSMKRKIESEINGAYKELTIPYVIKEECLLKLRNLDKATETKAEKTEINSTNFIRVEGKEMRREIKDASSGSLDV
ncbi:alanine--tRNA ligase, mitochondrial isoform X2 [Calliopsis andreniformis]